MSVKPLADLPAGPLARGWVPLYRQLAQRLREAIARARLAKGSLLPSEHELAERFGVSRITVRQALHKLEADGLIRRQRPEGTVVIGIPPARTRVKVTSFGPEPVPPEVAGLIGIRAGPPVRSVRGLRLLDGATLGAFAIHLAPAVGERLTGWDIKQRRSRPASGSCSSRPGRRCGQIGPTGR